MGLTAGIEVQKVANKIHWTTSDRSLAPPSSKEERAPVSPKTKSDTAGRDSGCQLHDHLQIQLRGAPLSAQETGPPHLAASVGVNFLTA